MNLKVNSSYHSYKKNIYSQNGEDGVILRILEELKVNLKNIEVCEFGAADGTEYSNTFNLVKKFNAKAVYIEEDKKLFSKLSKLTLKYKSIKAINKRVNFVTPDSLDEILLLTDISTNFDILSIDIDSDDLRIWESLKNYNPKIVIIEINSYLEPGNYQYHNFEKNNIGNSFTSTLEVGKKKGYVLVHHYGNLIFVKKEYSENLSLDKIYFKNPNLLFSYDWINKKNEFKIIKLIKLFLPKILIDSLSKEFKNRILKILYFFRF